MQLGADSYVVPSACSPEIKPTLQEDNLSALAGSSGGSGNTPEPSDTLQNRATHDGFVHSPH